jgi:hypothetical protein
MIDYFSTPPTPEETALRRIKGNFRRQFVAEAIQSEGLDSIPPPWLEHDLSMSLKDLLGAQAPDARGGEDLPDLDEGEVEIARLALTNAVHGEVTSLRARRSPNGNEILLRMVDEYETCFELPYDRVESPLTSEQVIELFRDADPSPLDTSCEVELQSFFHNDLGDLACHLGTQ